MPSTNCGLAPGDVIVIDPASRARLRDCFIPEGVIFRIFYKEERPMDPVALEPTEPVAHGPETTVTETVEAPASPDLTGLVQSTGGDPTLTIVLALVAVAGGAAGWKFWTQLSTQKHEQKMKAMELEAQKAGLNGAQPPPCQVKQLEVEKRLDAVEKKLSDMGKRMNALTKFDGPSADELDERLVKVEKALRKSAGAT